MDSGLLSRLLRKNWSEEKVDKYIGHYSTCYFAYANDENIRRGAASGGSITALLSFLFAKKRIDGALVCRGVINDEGKYRPQFYIARSAEELKQSQGSKYAAVNFAADAIPLIRKFNGRVAVVGLPCDIGIFRRQCEKDADLDKKVVLTISLFCGHNSEPALTDAIVDSLRPGDRPLIGFRHRVGFWRGMIQADFAEGYRITRPFSRFSDYQNLYYFSQRKCHLCHNHTGYDADVSAGDIWSMRMKAEGIKHSAIITRTPCGGDIVSAAIEAGWLHATVESIDEVCEGQARTMPFHYNVSARSQAAWTIGEKIPDTVHERFSLRDYIVAVMLLGNEKLSRTEAGRRRIFRIPRRLLKLYLYFIKGLESLP